MRSPFRTAERFGVEEIIDPRDTRPLLCAWARQAHRLVAHEAGGRPEGARPAPVGSLPSARMSRTPSTPTTSTSTPTTSAPRHERGEIQLIDVREPYEHEAGRIAGARHIELERLASQAETIDRDTPVVFYCRLGARSGMAANAFRRAGWDAHSMDGGLEEWAGRGLPLEPEGGHVADH